MEAYNHPPDKPSLNQKLDILLSFYQLWPSVIDQDLSETNPNRTVYLQTVMSYQVLHVEPLVGCSDGDYYHSAPWISCVDRMGF